MNKDLELFVKKFQETTYNLNTLRLDMEKRMQEIRKKVGKSRTEK